MICRLVHLGGRPLTDAAGSAGASIAHCASVRSCRLAAATLATRSPVVFRFAWSLTHLPETSSVIDHRHAGTSTTGNTSYEASPRAGSSGLLSPQLTAFFTSAPILASSAAVNSVRAKAVGHMAPSSRFALSLKPNVAYLVLNFCALWKKHTTLPSLAYAGIPYQSLGERAGALALMTAWSRLPMVRSGSRISAIFASTALSPSALSARGPRRAAAFSSWARSFIATRSSSVNPLNVLPIAVVLLADFCVAFLVVLLPDFCVPFFACWLIETSSYD